MVDIHLLIIEEIERNLIKLLPHININGRSFRGDNIHQMNISGYGYGDMVSLSTLTHGIHVYKWGRPDTDRLFPYEGVDAIDNVLSHLIKLLK